MVQDIDPDNHGTSRGFGRVLFFEIRTLSLSLSLSVQGHVVSSGGWGVAVRENKRVSGIM